jgi:cell division protein FtsQ
VRTGGAGVALRRLRMGRALRLPRLSPRLRLTLLVLAALALVLAAAYRFWLRDSDLVAVERVSVTGLTSDEASRLRSTLDSTARTMTTLHVDRDRLERAVEAFPVVSGLQVETRFPHELRIRVLEHHAAAMAQTDGGRVPVASDGTVLRGLPADGRLPTIRSDGGLRGERLRDREALSAALVAGTAPAVLHRRVEEVESRNEDGLVAELREGPELIFGARSRARAKWTAAARVLADPEAEGAAYIDVRIPGRPAAGGLTADAGTAAAPATPDTTLNP